MTPEREALAAAIAAHGEAIGAADKARETLDRAQAFVDDLEAQVAQFGDLDVRIASSRAESIKRAMATGATPTLEPSEELTAALLEKAEAEHKLSAARQALEALRGELDTANAAVKRAGLVKEWAAEKVLATELDGAAESFVARLSELRRDFYMLQFSMRQMVHRDPDAPKPAVIAGDLRPVVVSPAVVAAVRENVLGDSEARGGMRVRDEVASHVRDYFTALKSDAGAVFGDGLT
jgi:hypothetical protein